MWKIALFRNVIVFLLLLLPLYSLSQHFVNMHRDSIKLIAKDELPGFVFAKEVDNGNRSFIKYENPFEEQTLICMINDKGICTSVSRMYNTWMFNQLKDQLKTQYGQSQGLIWDFTQDDRKYEVELVKGEWYLTVITRRKKE